MIYLAITSETEDDKYFTFDDLMNAYHYIIKNQIKEWTLSDLPFLDENRLLDESVYKHVE